MGRQASDVAEPCQWAWAVAACPLRNDLGVQDVRAVDIGRASGGADVVVGVGDGSGVNVNDASCDVDSTTRGCVKVA